MQILDLKRLFGDKGGVVNHVADFGGQSEEGWLGHLDWAWPRAGFERHLSRHWGLDWRLSLENVIEGVSFNGKGRTHHCTGQFSNLVAISTD